MDASTAGGGFTRQGLRRACFQMRFKPDDLPKYLKDHEAVWPEMQTALRETGWHNYSLFYRGDGFAVGFFESDVGFAEACGRMDKTEVNARWQAAMAPYTADNTSPIDQASELEHCLYLGDNRVATLSEAPDGGAADSWHPQAFTGGGGLTATDRRRFAFQTRFDPAQLEALRADLGAMPRDTQQALREAGWHNFNLFLREDGFVVGYLEADAQSFQEARKRALMPEPCQRWVEHMRQYTLGNVSPFDADLVAELQHYFYLGTDQRP